MNGEKSEVKVALITGASKGIGYAIACELAAQGYSLGITSRSKQEIEEVAAKIKQQYSEVEIITSAFDIADIESSENFVSKVTKELGGISVLVNNAGSYHLGTSEMSVDELRRLIDVNYIAAAGLVRAVLPSMKKSGGGYIFNIASICGVHAFSDVGGYSASKFALVGYSEALSQELAPFGIKVTALCPSWVNTRNAERSGLESEEMIQPEDIALTVRYLLTLGKSASVREIVIHC